MLHPITVVNKHALLGILKPHQFYIGRGSPLGNQWSHLPKSHARFVVPTREAAIASYEGWFTLLTMDSAQSTGPEMTMLRNICRCALEQPTQLVCWCAPQTCHGDVIKAFIQKAYAERSK